MNRCYQREGSCRQPPRYRAYMGRPGTAPLRRPRLPSAEAARVQGFLTAFQVVKTSHRSDSSVRKEYFSVRAD